MSDQAERDQRLLGAADNLYALDAGEFTASRDALAASLQGEDKELAAQVKSLRKPTVAAWVLNLFVRREPEQVVQLLELGVALRAAQSALDGVELRALSRQRRQVTASMASRARALAAAQGQRLTSAVTDQVEASLTAALLDEEAGAALRTGMLLTAISVSGVEPVDLTSAVALPQAWGLFTRLREGDQAPARPAPRSILRLVPDPERRTRERRAAKEALTAADRALARAQRAQWVSQRRVDELEARVLQVHSEIDELRRRLVDLENAVEEAADEAARAGEERDEADETLRTAEAARVAAAEESASHE